MIITHELLQICKCDLKYTVIVVIFVVIIINIVIVLVLPRLRRLIASSTPQSSRFCPSSVHLLFVVNRVTLEVGFLRVLRFPPVTAFPQAIHSHASVTYHRHNSVQSSQLKTWINKSLLSLHHIVCEKFSVVWTLYEMQDSVLIASAHYCNVCY